MTATRVMQFDTIFRHAHIHLTPHEVSYCMGEAMGVTFKVASDVLDAFLKAHEEPVPDPVEMIRKITEASQFSQKFTDETVSSYLTEPEQSRFGASMPFTRAAQGLGPLQRIEVERFAGTLLEAPCKSSIPHRIYRKPAE